MWGRMKSKKQTNGGTTKEKNDSLWLQWYYSNFFPQCLSTSVVLKYWPSSGAKKQTFLFLFLSAEHLNFRCVPDCWRNFSIHFFKPIYKTWKTLQWVIMRNCLWNDWALWLNVTHMYLLERKEKQLYPTRVCGLNLLLQKSQYSNI